MRELYVIDTCALISFFDEVFRHAPRYVRSPRLSNRAADIIATAVYSGSTQIRLSIPSVVFIEIYEKWLRTEEFCRMFLYEVFAPLKKSANVEIRPTDREVLETLLYIRGTLTDHDLHDRIILASAMALNAPLITTDGRLNEYVKTNPVVPDVLC